MFEVMFYLGIALVVGAVIGRPVIAWIRRLGLGQKILEIGPAWHMSKQNTPTMGGIIFIAGIALAVLCGLPQMLGLGDLTPVFMLGLSLVFGGIGLIDDLTKIRKKHNQGLTVLQKLGLQFAAAVLFLSLMRSFGGLTNCLYIPFFGLLWEMPWWLFVAFALLLIVGFTNAVNLTDGIDGLCGTVTLLVGVYYSVVFMMTANPARIFSLALVGGLGAFLLFNHHPAKVFMGDTGALFLGGAVCAMAFAAQDPAGLLIIGIIYVIEAASDILQVGWFKISGGKRLFKMAPFHHHLEKCGWSENRIVAMFGLITAIAGAVLFIFG